MDEQKVIRHLLSRFFCRYFLPQLKERVHHFNTHYFKQEIKAVRMKYNKSNWGSCSRDKKSQFFGTAFFRTKGTSGLCNCARIGASFRNEPFAEVLENSGKYNAGL
ncbi:MAG: DUF45 domain-containing protein [Saprospiraceae bacterium]|nr:DUF45 domain-containing protein [Saprospiraceae bacterium]